MQKKYALMLMAALCLPAGVSAGKLAVISEPAGAEIILNHIRTGKFTPDTIFNLPSSEISVSLLHDSYQFTERKILLRDDSLLSLSFTQHSGFDPLTITGTQEFGILQLPDVPVESPWLLNDLIEDRHSVVLNAGQHRLQWDGGIAYEPIDTTIYVASGCIVAPVIPFKHRYGRINITALPEQAAIYIDSTLWGIGKVRKPLTAGTHQIKVTAEGYLPQNRELLLFPDQTLRDTIKLALSPDKDNDGFHDTVDLCPNLRGIYDGCPTVKRREEFRKIGSLLWTSFAQQPLTLELSPICTQYRLATNRDLRTVLTLFNDGSNFLSNYRGIQLANKFWISRGLFIGSVDWGYSFNGLRYEKPWIIPISDDSLELLHYDIYNSNLDNNPVFRILTVGAGAGIQLRGDPFTFSIITGYSHEIIDLSGVTKIDSVTGDSSFVSESINNSFWNTTARVVIAIKKVPLAPSIYGEMGFAPNNDGVTGWLDARVGVIIPWWRMKSQEN